METIAETLIVSAGEVDRAKHDPGKMETTAELLEKVLADLKRTRAVQSSAIVSREGLLMASNISGGVSAETFAAMSAAMLGAAESTTSELKMGAPEEVTIKLKEAELITISAGPEALLTVVTNPGSKLGLLLVEMKKASGKIRKLLGGYHD